MVEEQKAMAEIGLIAEAAAGVAVGLVLRTAVGIRCARTAGLVVIVATITLYVVSLQCQNAPCVTNDFLMEIEKLLTAMAKHPIALTFYAAGTAIAKWLLRRGPF